MARWRECLALLCVAGGMTGCVSGALLDAARRVETPVAIRDARLAGDRLVVRYDAIVTTDLGKPVARTVRWAAVPLDELHAPATGMVVADAVRADWLDDADPRTTEGIHLALCGDAGETAGACAVGQPGVDVEYDADGRLALLRVTDAGVAPLPVGALTRIHTAPWAWPLLPLAIAADVAVTPPLVALWPIFPAVGD